MMLPKTEERPAQPGRRFVSEIAQRLLVTLVAIVLTLALIEFPALMNVVDYKAVIGPLRGYYSTIRYDPQLLYIKRPHAHYSGTRPGGDISSVYQIPPSDLTRFQWDVKYDQNGCRNEADLKNADIVVIGDSMVEGITVPTAQIVTSLLARDEGQVVANLGQSAYGPQQELVALKRFGLPLRPRTVLWVFSEASDLKDVVWYDALMRNPQSFWAAFYNRSFTRTVYHALRESIGPKPPGVKRAGVIQTANGKTVTMYFLSVAAPLSKQDLGALDETAGILAEAQRLCAAQRAKLVFVFAPDKFRVFHSFCQFPPGSECRNWVVSDLPERLRRVLESISPEIGYVDLTPALVDAVRRGVLPYYPDDAHWTPEGHRIAAEAINNHLLSRPKYSPAN
jgi:hypothetical protein